MRRPDAVLASVLLIFACAQTAEAHGHGQGSVETLLAHDLSSHEGPGDNFNNDLARNFHSPRLEYNEWLPVGRGDPLKNDPTYDYSPPVLDRVRYWSDGAKDKAAGNDILLLGVPSKKSSVGVGKDWNSVPLRRNYFSPQQHQQQHALAAPNQLPTVLMPPPLNSFLAGSDGPGFWGGSGSAGASQRVDNQPGDGFKYRPANGFPVQGQYQGPKHPDPAISQPITAQFHHHHQPPPQGGGAAAAATGGFNRQQQQQHPYVTTIRLTTPAGDTVKRPLLKTILQNEHAYPFTKTAMTSTVTEYTSGGFYDAQNINAMAQTVFHPPQTTEYLLQQQPTRVAPKLSTEIRAPFVTPAGPFVTPVSTIMPQMTSTTTMAPWNNNQYLQHQQQQNQQHQQNLQQQPQQEQPQRQEPQQQQHHQQAPQQQQGSSMSSNMASMVGFNAPVTTSPTPPSMTTDAIFSHYKQPTTPERWSPYLIIEGHSKVKTYGLNTNDTLMQLPRMVPIASTKDPIVRHVVNRDPETGAEMSVTHVATRRPPVYEVHTERTRPAKEGEPKPHDQQGSAVDTLLSLLDTASFGEMLKDEGAIGNTLDGEEGAASGPSGKDSKTRRNVRLVRQVLLRIEH